VTIYKQYLLQTSGIMRARPSTEEALTGLELVILLVILIAGSAMVLMFFNGGTPLNPAKTLPGGIVTGSVYITGDHIQTVGNVYGFPMTSRTYGPLPVITVCQNSNQLGAARFTVSLFIGDTGAIDMDRVQVTWAQTGSTEVIRKTPPQVLVCPNWTISNKYNMLPGRKADADELLEPNEQFEITLCPSTGTTPYGQFTITLQPEGVAAPLTLPRMAPARIQPVMNLG
jgi:hypothetical protein